jgi:hypothetical protein
VAYWEIMPQKFLKKKKKRTTLFRKAFPGIGI